MEENGARPEFEACDVGHLHNLHHSFARHRLREPVYVQFVALGTASRLLVGGARVGLEGNLWLSKGEMARSSAERVEKMVRIAREFGSEPASPEETGAVSKLQGRDGVVL